jgi:programmed cell death protein 5
LVEEDTNQNSKMQKTFENQMKEAQLEKQKREIARRYLAPDAYERLMNVRVANPEVYDQLIGVVIRMIQGGNVTGRITEQQLKSILAKITTRPESKIEFIRK